MKWINSFSTITGIFCMLMFQVVYGWNSTGHQLIAGLALRHLSTAEITRLLAYNNAYHRGFQPKNLTSAAVWLDWVHCNKPGCISFSKYHYIDFPYSIDGSVSRPPDKVNAVFAIQQALVVLNSQQSSDIEKGLQLRILLHVIGDIHQPLHAISLYSRDFPQGDRGGNDYLIGQNRVGKNLHAYWDRGGGALTRKSLHHQQGLEREIQRLERKYPCDMEKMKLNPNVWAKESYELAIKEAYQLKFEEKPNRTYKKTVKQETENRISLAACRLAASLKKVL